MEIEIAVASGCCRVGELRRALARTEACTRSGIELEMLRVRGADTAIIVALAAAGGAAITELVRGVLAVANSLKAQKIVLQGKDGARVEIPADLPKADVDFWIRKASELDVKRITL